MARPNDLEGSNLDSWGRDPSGTVVDWARYNFMQNQERAHQDNVRRAQDQAAAPPASPTAPQDAPANTAPASRPTSNGRTPEQILEDVTSSSADLRWALQQPNAYGLTLANPGPHAARFATPSGSGSGASSDDRPPRAPSRQYGVAPLPDGAQTPFGAVRGGLIEGMGFEYHKLLAEKASAAAAQAVKQAELTGVFDGLPTLARQELEARISHQAAQTEIQRRLADDTIRQTDLDDAFRHAEFAERRRQFDSSSAEDRRQFDVTSAFEAAREVARAASNPRDYLYAAMLGHSRGGLAGLPPTNQFALHVASARTPSSRVTTSQAPATSATCSRPSPPPATATPPWRTPSSAAPPRNPPSAAASVSRDDAGGPLGPPPAG